MPDTQVKTDLERARDVLVAIAENDKEMPRERIMAAEALLKWVDAGVISRDSR